MSHTFCRPMLLFSSLLRSAWQSTPRPLHPSYWICIFSRPYQHAVWIHPPDKVISGVRSMRMIKIWVEKSVAGPVFSKCKGNNEDREEVANTSSTVSVKQIVEP
jgi:hypothetical protein